MENKITVYTTTHCPYCTMLKNFLTQQNIPFKEVNVEKDPIMMRRLVNQTGQFGVPQTEINGKWIIGYDPQRIMAALN
ncbi:glutaredoxin domain-containing protein [Caldifermentibacillus hisashii]|uniref:glutaredoxin family protein n=1 Tax=Caldifermentibacillus hisashii TaxID=996558 RepID=UPI0031FC0C06